MNFRSIAQQVAVVFLCICLSVPAIPSPGPDGKKRVVIHVGSPSVWSMGQAHYLLMKMHQKNGSLSTKQPEADDLDPNGVNATRIQILKTLLSIQAEFDQKLGVENRVKVREYERKLQDRELAQQRLREVESEIRKIDEEQPASKLRLASLKLERDQKQALLNPRRPPSRGNETSSASTTEEVQSLNQQIALLEEEIKLKNERRIALEAEQTRLRTEATKDITLGSLANPTIGGSTSEPGEGGTGGNTSLPPLTELNTYLSRSVGQVDRPRLAASVALDNYIGMQYEIISKQLTLLRDEVGPNNRIVFLELPASIYTVDGKGDDYLAQVKWEITHYAEASENEQKNKEQKNDEARKNSCETGETTPENQTKPQQRPDFLKQSKYQVMQAQVPPPKKDEGAESDLQRNAPSNERGDDPKKICDPCVQALVQLGMKKADAVNEVDKAGKETDYSKKRLFRENDLCWQKADSDLVKAIDIIPRQSSLNVNEVQATASQKNFLGLFKFLTGLGVSVNYQRQKQLYEQFLQQEVFAAGFGKGMNSFGWTFGPLPGSRRIAPGVRTMYAVLVVPRLTKQLKIQASGIAYHRKELPQFGEKSQQVFKAKYLLADQADSESSCKEKDCVSAYNVLVPGEVTTTWYAEDVDYTPAKVGEPVTVVLRGSGFSNQTSLLVDSIPLKRVISLGNSASSQAESEAQTSSGIHGQFEVVNSRQIAMRFMMGNSSYVGTPTITVVAPEKTDSINFYRMNVNGRYEVQLNDRSMSEPMFVEPFTLDEKKFTLIKENIPVAAGQNFVLAKIQGRGLRRDAAIWIGDKRIEYRRQCEPCEDGKNCISRGVDYCLSKFCDSGFAAQTDTNEYLVYFPKPAENKWPIRYRQQTVRGFEDKEFEYDNSPPTKVRKVQIISYSVNLEKRVAYLSLRFTKDKPIEAELSTSCSFNPPLPNCTPRKTTTFYEEGMKNWRANFEINLEDRGNGNFVERDEISVTVKTEEKFQENGAEKTEQVVWSNDLSLPVTPRIKAIDIFRPAIAGDTGTELRIYGLNLQNVKKVFVAGQEVDIIGTPGKDMISVKLKGGAFIKEEKGVKVPVVLVTNDGTSVAGVVTENGSSDSDSKKTTQSKKK